MRLSRDFPPRFYGPLHNQPSTFVNRTNSKNNSEIAQPAKMILAPVTCTRIISAVFHRHYNNRLNSR